MRCDRTDNNQQKRDTKPYQQILSKVDFILAFYEGLYDFTALRFTGITIVNAAPSPCLDCA